MAHSACDTNSWGMLEINIVDGTLTAPVCEPNTVDAKINKARFLTVGLARKHVTNLILFRLSQIYCLNEYSLLVSHSPSAHLFLIVPSISSQTSNQSAIPKLLTALEKLWPFPFDLLSYLHPSHPFLRLRDLEGRAGSLPRNWLTNT